MNITFVHDLDTGFLSRTLKQPLIDLGHNVKVIQTMITQIEGENSDHIDIHTGGIKDEKDYEAVHKVFRETDFFIIRSISDVALRLLRVSQYCTDRNAIYKVHGSELRELNHPYSLLFWRTLRQPLILCGPRDPSLLSKYRGNVITHINKPCDFDSFPRRNRNIKQPFALHTPTNPQRKGTQKLLDTFTEEGKIELLIYSGVPRTEILKTKAQASYFIDHLGTYEHGPYGVNSIEAWFYKIPVWSNVRPIDRVMCPDLHYLVNPFSIDTIAREIRAHEPDKRLMRKCKEYALRAHNKHTIAKQYSDLARSMTEQ
jgi:hypothetical protein